MRKWLIRLGVVVVVLVAAAGVAYRLYYADPVRSTYCKLLPCGELDAYESLCRAAAIVEFTEFDSVAERHAALLETLDAEPNGPAIRPDVELTLKVGPPERYEKLENAAREAGAPNWQCPPLARVVTSTVP